MKNAMGISADQNKWEAIRERMTQEDRAFAKAVSDRIKEKLEWVSEKNAQKIPYTTGADGSYDDRAAMDLEKEDWGLGLSWWTNGFWGGLLWQLHHVTGKERYAEIARWSEKRMDECFLHYYGLHHDVGFMWMPTAVADYRLTADRESLKRGLIAAQLLAGRYNPAGEFIRAWNDLENEDTRGWAIIDCMMNLSLLYWASEESGDPRYREIATKHADTVMRSFIREDGSSNHIVEFDPERGGVIRTYGGQGYENGSAWTRGQAWAIYGFTISYLHTGKAEYLETAKKVADFFVANIPENGLIAVDFRQPAEPALEDCCGAAIAASGLIELAQQMLVRTGGTDEGRTDSSNDSGHVSEEMQRQAALYLDAAVKILRAIDEKRASWGTECDAIVQNCTGAYHSNDHHITMVYADYYFAEAVFKLTGEGVFLW